MLEDLALGVPVPCAAPLCAELAGELGCDAILNWIGWVGGLDVPTGTAICTLGGV